jgi:hypothetical protein
MGETIAEPLPQEAYDFIEIILKVVHDIPRSGVKRPWLTTLNLDRVSQAHILNTPKRVSDTSALRQADNASATTLRVSAGAMMPSSHSRAVAK